MDRNKLMSNNETSVLKRTKQVQHLKLNLSSLFMANIQIPEQR